VVAAALYQVLIYQHKFYRHERARSVRHDALRVAGAVLTAELMEASGSEGDFGSLEPDSLTVRSPVGFGIVCAVDSTNGILSVIGTEGRASITGGDSLLIYHPDGWLVLGMAEEISQASAPSCVYASGPPLEAAVRVNGSVTGVPAGAPVRAFHRYTYRLEEDGSAWWLARYDGSSSDLLAGPFSGDGTGLAFVYRDDAGQVTSDPSRVARLDLTLVAEYPGPQNRLDTLTASVSPRNQ
jgi:hypothetical protein